MCHEEQLLLELTFFTKALPSKCHLMEEASPASSPGPSNNRVGQPSTPVSASKRKDSLSLKNGQQERRPKTKGALFLASEAVCKALQPNIRDTFVDTYQFVLVVCIAAISHLTQGNVLLCPWGHLAQGIPSIDGIPIARRYLSNCTREQWIKLTLSSLLAEDSMDLPMDLDYNELPLFKLLRTANASTFQNTVTKFIGHDNAQQARRAELLQLYSQYFSVVQAMAADGDFALELAEDAHHRTLGLPLLEPLMPHSVLRADAREPQEDVADEQALLVAAVQQKVQSILNRFGDNMLECEVTQVEAACHVLKMASFILEPYHALVRSHNKYDEDDEQNLISSSVESSPKRQRSKE